MRVIVFKSYSKRDEVFYNYGDDCEVIWHHFKSVEEVMELTEDEYNELLEAIDYFNKKVKRNYNLQAVIVTDESEIRNLISDFHNYKKEEEELALKRQEANRIKLEADRVKRKA